MQKKIITITLNDLSISWGPAVHYLELWNSFSQINNNEFDVIGYAPKIIDDSTIVKPLFLLNKIQIPQSTILKLLTYDFLIAIKLWKHRNDIVYIRTANFSILPIFIIQLFNIKPIVELNGIASKDALSANKNWIHTKLTIWQEKKYIQLASGCIAVSDGIKEFANSIGSKNTITILNGISDDFFKLQQKSVSNILKIVYVGTFTSWDGAKYIPDLAAKNPQIEFHMIGDGPNRKSIEDISPKNVIYLGYKKYNDLKLIYQNYDAGIVLYDIERNDMKISSLKTLEYMASGLPIFTTDVPGQEFIAEKKIGICTTFEKLDDNFKLFITNLKSYKENLQIFRKEYKDNYSWNGVAIKTKEFIKQVSV